MSYRNKTYIIFNANYPEDEGDIRYYWLMTAWKENKSFDFRFHNAHELNRLTKWASEEQIKRKLRERMRNSKQAIVLVGNHTRNLYKFVRWEIKTAIEMDLPIIAANLDRSNYASDRTPPILRENCYFVTVPFEMKKIRYALNYFPEEYRREKHLAPSPRYYDWSTIPAL